MVTRINLFFSIDIDSRTGDFFLSASPAKNSELSYMISPVRYIFGLSIVYGGLFSGRNPSLIRFLNAAFVGAKSRVEEWSLMILLISSGIVLLNDLSPASIWITGK